MTEVWDTLFASIKDVDIWGMGAMPLALALSIMIAILVNNGQVRNGKYRGAGITFIMSFLFMYVAGIATNSPFGAGFGAILIVMVALGVLMSEE